MLSELLLVLRVRKAETTKSHQKPQKLAKSYKSPVTRQTGETEQMAPEKYPQKTRAPICVYIYIYIPRRINNTHGSADFSLSNEASVVTHSALRVLLPKCAQDTLQFFLQYLPPRRELAGILECQAVPKRGASGTGGVKSQFGIILERMIPSLPRPDAGVHSTENQQH